jgi:hypothetical protein
MTTHEIIWTEPSPFWPEATTAPSNATAQTEFQQPAILRFTTDSFMNEFFNVIATDPLRLGEYRARPETWRGFVTMPQPNKPAKAFALALQRLGFARKHASNGSGPALPTQPPPLNNPPPGPLKLYQPAHQRYYLVTGCLICQMPGLPDRKLDTSKQEKATFVVRRFLPPPASDPNANIPFDPTAWKEHAFISSPTGSYWQPANGGVVDGEEQLPLFAANFQQDDQRQRRLLAGLIPAGKREAYIGAGSPPVNGSGPGATTQINARKVLFRTQVAEPWKALVDRALTLINFANPPDQTKFDQSGTLPPVEFQKTLSAVREQIQTASWLILSDFADYLKNYLPDVWGTLQNPGPALSGAPADLLAALQSTVISSALKTSSATDNLVVQAGSPSTIASSLADALSRLIANSDQIDRMEKTLSPYLRGAGQTNPDWPDFLFPLADPVDLTSAQPVINQPPGFNAPPEDDTELAPPPPPSGGADDVAKAFKQQIDRFAALVIRALPADMSADQPAPHLASQKPADLREGFFVIRFIYERPACGPLHDDVVSPPTTPFQLAGFFDPDAPARPIRIGLPLDTTPAGIRKFDRNTAFMISDVLCGQIQRFKALTLGDLVRSVLPWPLHKDLSVPDGGPCAKTAGGPSFGMICSLSIPIITLCAFILLIIMVILFDIIFRWLPFFVICFPVPGLKGKK